ncbi:MAG: Uma2 family endonuclease [Planctomycetes bacterium]|nr:Uma2 family endonuclease [Planctomycetota bacterium]
MKSLTTREQEVPSFAPPAVDGDQFIVLHNVSWEKYVALSDLIGEDHPNLKMVYLEGTLELMVKGPGHEKYKKTIARLVELYALERDIALNGYGEMTRRKKEAQRGLEPDECYLVGRILEDEVRLDIPPDIALEVSITSGFIDKLKVYWGLGVPEVWFYRRGRIEVHRLAGDAYEERERSEFLPDLDLGVLARFAANPDQTAAVRGYRDWLRGR